VSISNANSSPLSRRISLILTISREHNAKQQQRRIKLRFINNLKEGSRQSVSHAEAEIFDLWLSRKAQES
jgi:hypothetical protein